MARYTIAVGTKVGIAKAEEMDDYSRGYVRWRDYATKRDLTFTEFVHFSGSEYIFGEGDWLILVGHGLVKKG